VIRAQIVELATTTYGGFNPVHLAEMLAEEVGLALAPRTVRQIHPVRSGLRQLAFGASAAVTMYGVGVAVGTAVR
jgi:hypothetical protein